MMFWSTKDEGERSEVALYCTCIFECSAGTHKVKGAKGSTCISTVTVLHSMHSTYIVQHISCILYKFNTSVSERYLYCGMLAASNSWQTEQNQCSKETRFAQVCSRQLVMASSDQSLAFTSGPNHTAMQAVVAVSLRSYGQHGYNQGIRWFLRVYGNYTCIPMGRVNLHVQMYVCSGVY